MFRGKESNNSKPKKCHVRFKTNPDSNNLPIGSNETNILESNSQGTFTYYLSKLANIFTTGPSRNEEENSIDKPEEERKNITRDSHTGSSLSLSDISSRHSLTSTSKDSLETDFSPEKMSGDEQSAYHVVKSALKYGYTNHIINRKDHVFWLRKFPTQDFNNTAIQKREEERLKARKRKRPTKGKRKKRSGEERTKAELSTESSSESILNSPYKICKIKCVSRK